MAQVTLSDGRTLELRPMYISEKLKLVKMEEDDSEERYLDVVTAVAAIIEPAVVSKSWEGSLLDMTDRQMLTLTREWSSVTEDDALPPENAPDSETK